MKRGTAAQWASNNPVLAAGEIGLETDTLKAKFGNGTSAYSALSYFVDGTGGGGGTVGGTATISVGGPAGGSFEWLQTVAATGLTAGDRVHVQLAPENDAAENGPEMLDVVSLTASCPADDTITVAATFGAPVRGPISLIYGVI